MIPPEVIAEAKRQWSERELKFPAFVRQMWEQGTDLAKNTLLARVASAMRASPDRAETGTGSVSEANSTRSREAGGAQ